MNLVPEGMTWRPATVNWAAHVLSVKKQVLMVSIQHWFHAGLRRKETSRACVCKVRSVHTLPFQEAPWPLQCCFAEKYELLWELRAPGSCRGRGQGPAQQSPGTKGNCSRLAGLCPAAGYWGVSDLGISCASLGMQILQMELLVLKVLWDVKWHFQMFNSFSSCGCSRKEA